MTNLLIPTDCSVNSVKNVEQVLKSLSGRKVNIVLFHAFSLPTSSIDLITGASKYPYHEVMNENFRQACKQLKDRFPQNIQKINFKYMLGDTLAVFRNFADANDIDMIYVPENYNYTKIHDRSLNPLSFFNKSGIPFYKTPVFESFTREVVEETMEAEHSFEAQPELATLPIGK